MYLSIGYPIRIKKPCITKVPRPSLLIPKPRHSKFQLIVVALLTEAVLVFQGII
jgi:hypothetical protein